MTVTAVTRFAQSNRRILIVSITARESAVIMRGTRTGRPMLTIIEPLLQPPSSMSTTVA